MLRSDECRILQQIHQPVPRAALFLKFVLSHP